MLDTDADTFSPLIQKMARHTTLDDAALDAIKTLSFTTRSVLPNRYLVREGDMVSECCVLLDGYACRHKVAANGARQIVSFHIPGDILDLQHLLLARADHDVQTITAAKLAWVPIEEIRTLAREHPALGEALWRDSLIDASIFREWVLNVGRRSAKARIAHMLCEFAVRREAAGLGPAERFELPMTQEQIADATGLTPVHVNRMLAELTAEGLIGRQGRRVEISDWPSLRHAADFNPAYLHKAA